MRIGNFNLSVRETGNGEAVLDGDKPIAKIDKDGKISVFVKNLPPNVMDALNDEAAIYVEQGNLGWLELITQW